MCWHGSKHDRDKKNVIIVNMGIVDLDDVQSGIIEEKWSL